MSLRNAVSLALGAVLAAAGTVSGQISILNSFTGSTYSQSGFFPPDTMGAVGTDHFVELLNGRYVVHVKATGGTADSSSLDTFWHDAGVNPAGSFPFDPRVLYDHVSGRWFACSVDASFAPNNFLIAVSATSDPTDGWTGFQIDADTDNLQWADFPTMGLDDEGLYVSANMFEINNAPFVINMLIVPKADLLLPVPTVANATLLESISTSVSGASVQPAVDFDFDPGFEVPLLSRVNLGSLRRSSFVGSVLNPSISSGPLITTPSFSSPPDADQPPLPFQKDDLDTFDGRFSGNVILRNGMLWAVQSGNADGRSAVRFLKIDAATNTLLESTIISDPDLAYYYPSIAVNEFEEVVIGFSGSSSTQPVSAYAVAGETEGGLTSFFDPILLQPGLDDYERLDGIGRNRWGDYSATMVDPVDPQLFWTVQEFVLADDVWATRITELIFAPIQANDQCASATPVGNGSFPFDTIAATTDGVPTTCQGGGGGSAFVNDIWYIYTPPDTGVATFSTCNDANFDTRVAVYFSPFSCPVVTSPATCNDDAAGCGETSVASTTVIGGFEYLVRVGGTTGGGQGTLTIALVAFCGNGEVNPGENCETCPEDVPCPPGSRCVDAVCKNACPWDCGDGDGEVGIVDFLALLAQWGQIDTSCDPSGTGVGIVEFLDLLANWGPCP